MFISDIRFIILANKTVRAIECHHMTNYCVQKEFSNSFPDYDILNDKIKYVINDLFQDLKVIFVDPKKYRRPLVWDIGLEILFVMNLIEINNFLALNNFFHFAISHVVKNIYNKMKEIVYKLN